MAFTGIAAILLLNGKTVHKILSLPVTLLADSTSKIKFQSKEATFLKNIDVFIWDESPMAPKYSRHVMNNLLQNIMGNNKLFESKLVILGEDFRQLLPVLARGTRSEALDLFIKNSVLWKHFEKFTLTRNMRALAEENDFAKFVLDVGNGSLNDNNDNINLDIPDECIFYKFDASMEIFGNCISEKKVSEMSKRAILSARNVDVDEINQEVVQLLDSAGAKTYTTVDSAEMAMLLPEYLNSLNPPSLPQPILYQVTLKKKCYSYVNSKHKYQ